MSMAPNGVKYYVFLYSSSCSEFQGSLQGSRTASIFADERVCIHGHCEVLQGERKCTELMEGLYHGKLGWRGCHGKFRVRGWSKTSFWSLVRLDKNRSMVKNAGNVINRLFYLDCRPCAMQLKAYRCCEADATMHDEQDFVQTVES